MMQFSYRSRKTELRESEIHGRGLFATADISKDKIVAVKGGHVIDRKTLREEVTPRLGQWKFRSTRICSLRLSQTKAVNCRYYIRTTPVIQTLVCAGRLRSLRCATFACEELTHGWAMT